MMDTTIKTTTMMTTGRPSDEDILNFENRIREEQVNVHPLISVPLPLSVLEDEYASSSNHHFLPKIKVITYFKIMNESSIIPILSFFYRNWKSYSYLCVKLGVMAIAFLELLPLV